MPTSLTRQSATPNAASAKPEVSHCRSCGAPIWWGETAKGKRCPFNYDLVTATPTQESHFATCPQAKTWTKREPAKSARLPYAED